MTHITSAMEPKLAKGLNVFRSKMFNPTLTRSAIIRYMIEFVLTGSPRTFMSWVRKHKGIVLSYDPD